MLNLGAAISEYEDRELMRKLWEEPDKFAKIASHDPFVISGRKGSGKSTIVDYMQATANCGGHVIVIRPDEHDNFYDRLREISEDMSDQPGDARQSLSKLFELISYLECMKLAPRYCVWVTERSSFPATK